MHIKSLDGLRGIAALWVCAAHLSRATGMFPEDGAGGKMGVAVFFILSGFLMGHLYFNQSPTRDAVGRFFRKRAARVLPLYFLVVLVSFAVVMIDRDLWPYQVWLKRLPAHLFVLKGTNVMWTIPIEVHFYLLFPLFWFLRHKLGDKAVWLFAGMVGVFYLLPDPPMRWITGSWHWFVAGLVVSCIPVRVAPVWNIGLLASIVGTVLIFPSVAGPENAYEVWRSPVCLLVIASLLVCTIRAPLAQTLLGNRPLSYIGKISYSLYLLHCIPLFFLTEYTDLEGWVLVAVFAASSLALAYASYRWVEQPARESFTSQRGGRVLPATAS